MIFILEEKPANIFGTPPCQGMPLHQGMICVQLRCQQLLLLYFAQFEFDLIQI